MAFESLKRIDHVIFSVADLERSVSFYRDTLDFSVLMDERELRLTPESPNRMSVAIVERADDVIGMVELVQFVEPPAQPRSQGGYFDLGFWAVVWEVTDLDGIYREWSSRGVEFLREPELQRIPSQGTLYSTLLTDVDGNRIELVQV